MHRLIIAAAALMTSACATAGEQSFEEAASGAYELEKSHASLIWKVRHNGLSNYTARFTDFDATLDFDPDNPVASSVSVSINPMSVETDHPTKADEWNTELGSEAKWLNGEEFPVILFTSTGIEQTGEFTGKLTGDVTFLGVTKPVTLDVTYNGTGNAPWFGTRDIVGFSARGTLTRSEFGLTTLASIVGDEVEVIIEAEFVEAE